MELNKIYNEDCLVGMQEIPDKSIDAIICDLPYGTTACKWDNVIPFEPLWEQYKRIIKNNGAIVLFGSQPFTSALVMSNTKWFKYELIWEKDRPSNPLLANKRIMPQHENILIFYKNQPVFTPQKVKRLEKNLRANKNNNNHTHTTDTKGKTKIIVSDGTEYRHPYSINFFSCVKRGGLHPTQKPVELLEYLIKTYTNEGDLVLDNTMGSGTTNLACIKLNRKSIGIEKEKQYYDVAVRRASEYCH